MRRQEAAAGFGFAWVSGEEVKRRRASVLCAWLVEAFGAERLTAGSGVLDVAGVARSTLLLAQQQRGMGIPVYMA
jgi:hypothetical protein